MTMRPPIAAAYPVIGALRDPEIFGSLPAFRDLTSWRRWQVFLKAVDGLPLDAAEEVIFRHHTGRACYAPPPGGYQTTAAIVGRQSGKTQIAAVLAAHAAITAPRSPGRTPIYATMIAQDHRATLRVLFAYATEPFETVPLLQGSVVARTNDTLTLDNGVVLAAYPCRPPALRGIRSRIVVCDEIAHYRSAEGNPQDVELLRAVRPTLATTGGRLVLLSSPYGQAGSLWDLYRAHYGKDDSPVLIWKGTAPEMNPTLSADYLERMREDDPEGYRSEVEGEFRAGVTALFDPEALDACVARDVRERLPEAGVGYAAGADPSGGRRDRFTVAIAHRAGDRVVLDVVRSWESPFNPSGVVSEAADLLRRYGVGRVTGDGYGAELIAELFRQHRIDYDATIPNRSELFLELLPVVNAGAVALPDLPPLLRELRGLERRRGVTGRDRVVPSPHEHDDRACAVAAVVYRLAKRGQAMFEDLGDRVRREQAGDLPVWICPTCHGDRAADGHCPQCNPPRCPKGHRVDPYGRCWTCQPGPTLRDLGLGW